MNEKELKNGMKPKAKKTKSKKMSLIDDLKMEIASELGIVEQIENEGWDSLSPRVSGQIGGKLSQRLRKMGKK